MTFFCTRLSLSLAVLFKNENDYFSDMAETLNHAKLDCDHISISFQILFVALISVLR